MARRRKGRARSQARRGRGGSGAAQARVKASTRSLPSLDGTGVLWGGVVITLAVILAYANSLNGPFIFDDIPNILANPAIRDLSSPAKLLDPPPDAGIASRPIVSLSLAINYAVSGYGVWSYHLLNLIIHAAAALALFGIVRRMLASPRMRPRFEGVRTPLAAGTALLWALHPLQTQAVTYVIQRCESLMGLFFLLSLYCAIRGWSSAHRMRWHLGAILACLAGVGTKEVIAAAPVVILLYDVVFNGVSPREALRRSPLLYAGMVVCWGVLAITIATVSVETLHPETLPVTPSEYARTQPQVMLHYLRLIVWPSPLVLDYAWPVAPMGQIWGPAIALIALIGAAIWGLVRRHPLGFAGAWFFVILAPSSSIVPIQDLAFEHRLYLSLAGAAGAFVIGGYALAQRYAGRRSGVSARGSGTRDARETPDTVSASGRVAFAGVIVVLALLLGALTHVRNRDYQSEVAIWADTVAKRPLNARAHLSLGVALGRAGRGREALQHTQESLRLNPNSAKAQVNHGIGLLELGRAQEAVRHFEHAIELEPDYVSAHSNLGIAYCQMGRLREGVRHLRDALELDPDCVEAHFNLAIALRELGHPQEAQHHYREAVRIDPRYVSPGGGGN